MGEVASGIDKIARSRVRDALLSLTRDGPAELHVHRIANEAAVDPAVVEQVLDELHEEGPFSVDPVAGDRNRWRVV